MTSPRPWSPQDTEKLAAVLAAMYSRVRDYPVPRQPAARLAARALWLVLASLAGTVLALAVIAAFWLLAVLWWPAYAVVVLRRRRRRGRHR